MNIGAYSFSPNTSRLQSALHGSKRKAEVASARRKLPDDDSTLPRLLTAVYTPLPRCATASDARNLAGGLRTKQTGNTSQVPRFAFLGDQSCYPSPRREPRSSLVRRLFSVFRAVCGVFVLKNSGICRTLRKHRKSVRRAEKGISCFQLRLRLCWRLGVALTKLPRQTIPLDKPQSKETT